MGLLIRLMMHGRSVAQIERGFWIVVLGVVGILAVAYGGQVLFPPA